jgi:2-oxoglutarate ferredoxin oxidoreductase subunit beta
MTTLDYTRVDFQTDQEPRWCPGCGDYTILSSVQKHFAQMGVARENVAVISGIGCSSRFPYYVDTYGMHSIHGRAPAIASGLSVTRPDLSVWVVTGDGDAMSIGGNHLIHALRRNVNLKILLFNNQIYGLTKGQYSPTSEVGKKTKSSPAGSLDFPFNPISLALGAEASFVARCLDSDPKHTEKMLQRAYDHDGSAFIEIYQNCNVFNDKAFIELTGKSQRAANRIYMEHGEKMLFGVDNENCVVIENGEAKFAAVADVAEGDIYVHDEFNPNPAVAFALSRLNKGPNGPTPLGVYRDVDRPTYDKAMVQQVADVTEAKGKGDLNELIRGLGTWTVS